MVVMFYQIFNHFVLSVTNLKNRKMAKDTFYFSHDFNARQDAKKRGILIPKELVI